MILSVTAEDLARGHALTPLSNPLTWAISRQTGWSYAYEVGRLWPVCGPPVPVTDEVRNWMAALARKRRPPEPREFELELPGPTGS